MAGELPSLSYTALGRQDQENDTDGDGGTEENVNPYLKTANVVFMVLTWAILIVVLLVWAVVGAVFWIPLLVRAMLRFCINLIEAMFEGQKPVRAARTLKEAVSFYRRGFVVAIEVVTKEEIVQEAEGPVTENRLLFEVFWAFLVWYLIALAMGWIEASPLDLLDWFLAIPWTDHIRGLMDTLSIGGLG
jgi:hypothetical protein